MFYLSHALFFLFLSRFICHLLKSFFINFLSLVVPHGASKLSMMRFWQRVQTEKSILPLLVRNRRTMAVRL